WERLFATWVACLDRLQSGHCVGRTRIDAIDEEEARVACGPRGVTDRLPHLPGVELAKDLAALRAATTRQWPTWLREQLECLAVVEGTHERVSDRDRDVEVRDAAVTLAVHELEDVRGDRRGGSPCSRRVGRLPASRARWRRCRRGGS